MSDQQHDSWLDNIRFVAHELKTPISVAKGFLDLVGNVGPLNEAQEQHVLKVFEALSRMERLVGSLSQAASIDSGKELRISRFEVKGLIDREVNALRPFAQQHKVGLNVEVEDDSGILTADPERFSHLLSNLVTNGIKYNKRGGQVWIKASGTEDRVRLEVQDNGIGIKDEDKPFIFDRFYRAQGTTKKIEGTGLGLYIVKSLVDLLGGTVSFESTFDEGTTFVVQLPREYVAEQSASASASS